MVDEQRVQRRADRLRSAQPQIRPVPPEWQAFIDAVVEKAPPLSASQRDQLALLIKPKDK